MNWPPILWLRALLFNIAFFGITIFMVLVAIPTLFLSRKAALRTTRQWAWLVTWALRVIVGVRIEVRGWEKLPPGGVVIAAKHQSAFDTIVWLSLLETPAYVMKKELLRIPFYGWHIRKVGNIPVDRDGGGVALRPQLRGPPPRSSRAPARRSHVHEAGGCLPARGPQPAAPPTHLSETSTAPGCRKAQSATAAAGPLCFSIQRFCGHVNCAAL